MLLNKKFILLGILIILFSNIAYAQTCEVSQVRSALKKAAFDYLTDPSTSQMPLSKVKDLLVFYLNIGSGQTTTDCSVIGANSKEKISNLVSDALNITRVLPTCSDGTKYGECSTFKPKYCYAGSLLHRCNYCSCPGASGCTTSGKCETIVNETITCTDSDGGEDYYVKGTVTLGTSTYADICNSGSTGLPLNGNYPATAVVEKYCVNNTLDVKYFDCPNGCKDGACVNETQGTIDGSGNWSYRKPINIANPGSALTDYQVLVTLDTASLISAGKMQADCDDIRSTNSDGTTLINHWLDSGCNSANTNIWVQVPSIPTAGATIFILYGNTEAATGSNFTSTFPNRYILASGTDNSSGAQNYDWFEVQSGATFTITDEIAQNITARKILIAGTVNGDARGFDGATSSSVTAAGPGGGSGKSGGGYGGAGGQGKSSAWGAGGTPGSAYGSASSQAIQMGSGGGASDNIQAPSGDGGGAVTFISKDIVISGTVTMNGGRKNTGTNQNGGGAGGDILILSSRVNLAGTLSANGGGADGGTVRAGGAGGGGGGRIKIFSDESISDTSTKNVNGGPGSPGGTNGGSFTPGNPGAAGTIHTGTFTSFEPIISVGAEE